jgi:predicted metal-binding membrane protein
MVSERASQQAFFGMSALLFAASATVTIVWGNSMSAMGDMQMPGGWAMSMAWVRMPGQSWPVAAASFLGMWVVMMVAMMMPSLFPMLQRYRQAVGRTGEMHLGWLTAFVGVGYFFVWTVFGMAVYPLGVGLAAAEMQVPALSRSIRFAVGAVILIAGLSSSRLGRRVTSPAAGRCPRAGVHCRRTPGRLGGMACVLDYTALSAALV